MKKRLITFLFMLSMVFSMSIVSFAAEDVADDGESKKTADDTISVDANRYYYDKFKNDAYRDVYDQIVKIADGYGDSSSQGELIDEDENNPYYTAFSVNIAKKKWDVITASGVQNIIDAVIADNPLYFWMSHDYTFTSKTTDSNNVVYTLNIECYEEYADSTVRNTIMNNINMGILAYGRNIKESLKDYEKAYLLHNDIIDDTYYNISADELTGKNAWAFSADGVFNSKHKSASTQGYAKAYKLVLDYLEIPCIYAEGNTQIVNEGKDNEYSYNDDGWVYVLLDNEWYLVSPGRDDPETTSGKDVLTYTYFNVTDDQAKALKLATNGIYHNAPDATGTKYSITNIKEDLEAAGLWQKNNYNIIDRVLDKYGVAVVLISLGVIIILIIILIKRIHKKRSTKRKEKIKATKVTVIDSSELDNELKKDTLS